ncbi:unnamed protein product [Ilex paraguariensis]|uniref:Uncharacterized protein n=1 Tax=Ilex paraguariensis TaxID=185542 RepID=A0ABC8TUL7_9AQUA
MLMNLHSKAIEVIIAPLVRPQAQVQRPVNPGLKRRGPGGAWDLQGPGGQNCSGLPQKMVIHIERVTPDKENGSMVNVTKVLSSQRLEVSATRFSLLYFPLINYKNQELVPLSCLLLWCLPPGLHCSLPQSLGTVHDFLVSLLLNAALIAACLLCYEEFILRA